MTVVSQQQECTRQSEETVSGDGVDVRNGLSDLEGTFKDVVTHSLDEILQKRPTDPIRFLADRLFEKSDSHEIEEHECLVGNDIHCTLKKACTRKKGADLCQVPGLPLLQLTAPTTFELDAALRHLETLTPSNAKVIIFVEPPNPPTDLFFLKGVPYFTNITEKLLQRRRGATDDTLLDEDDNERVGSAKKMTSLLQKALLLDVKTLQEELADVATPPSRFCIVELPEVQSNFLEVFDIIDRTFGVRKHYWNVRTTAPAEVPSALLASFNPRMSNMTFSRIIAAILPLYEQMQRSKIAATLEKNKARVQQLNYSYITQYWTEVLQRRDKRDQERAKLDAVSSQGKAPNQALSSGTKSSPGRKRRKESNALCVSRNQRRENEDATFLRVSQRLQSQAATRIQALYRGYRCRITGVKLRSQREVVPNTACWVENIPTSLPVLLQRCLERLSVTHGELFGNYVVSCPPSPRCVTVLKPLRRVLKKNEEDDVDSETESWEEETVILPLKRQTKPTPHFNALRRLMECELLGRCNTIDYATSIQQDCSGLSVLQRHAYDCYKSLVLNLMHIAFLELYYREKLPAVVATFSEYMYRLHGEVFGWLSAPHLFSRTALRVSGGDAPLPPILCERKVMETERVLLTGVSRRGSLFDNVSQCQSEKQESPFQDDPSSEEIRLPVLSMALGGFVSEWTCHGVHATPAFPPEVVWEMTLREVSLTCQEGKVAWWTLPPYPAVYLNGEALVLVPRHELQEVHGRPRFDDYVVPIEETTKESLVLPKNLFDNTVVEILRVERSRCGYSGVIDGLSLTNFEEKAPVDATPREDPPVVDEVSCFSTFGLSLRGEDFHLASLINRDRKLHPLGNLKLYSKVNPSGPYGIPMAHASQQPFVLAHQSEIRKPDESSLHDSIYLAGVSGSISRTNRRFRSRQRGSWCKTLEAVKKNFLSSEKFHTSWETSKYSLSKRSVLVSPEGTARGRREAETTPNSLSEAETVDVMARRLAQRVLKGSNFVHERPWITPVCGRAWVMVFEQFASKCYSQMCEGYSIVISMGDPFQVMLFNVVCLLKYARQSKGKNSEEAVESPFFGAPSCDRANSLSSFLLADETVSCLAFMDGFYECVSGLLKNSDVSVQEVVYVVHKIMQENSPGGMIFLNEIPALMKSAERETDPRLLVDGILAIVQRVELYCWLVLFQAFLASLAAAGVVDERGDVALSSFSAFVDDTALMTWMEQFDPWKKTPGKSPDPFHLRYSNGLRRWDDRNYIFSGAL
ncbi:hypothetical protein MOQ_004493 [Trypanosoma cruzi marinkellei]|uniref:Uncharacterized protein n=1 Tax=Trypanosoma cruzi marinkellei TaxID=85056 RepID=K2M9F1_TRYCR|nr:hypothetical protein MOQ_004493 [Trypanosoma cruzi marinkellei]